MKVPKVVAGAVTAGAIRRARRKRPVPVAHGVKFDLGRCLRDEAYRLETLAKIGLPDLSHLNRGARSAGAREGAAKRRFWRRPKPVADGRATAWDRMPLARRLAIRAARAEGRRRAAEARKVATGLPVSRPVVEGAEAVCRALAGRLGRLPTIREVEAEAKVGYHAASELVAWMVRAGVDGSGTAR